MLIILSHRTYPQLWWMLRTQITTGWNKFNLPLRFPLRGTLHLTFQCKRMWLSTEYGKLFFYLNNFPKEQKQTLAIYPFFYMNLNCHVQHSARGSLPLVAIFKRPPLIQLPACWPAEGHRCCTWTCLAVWLKTARCFMRQTTWVMAGLTRVIIRIGQGCSLSFNTFLLWPKIKITNAFTMASWLAKTKHLVSKYSETRNYPYYSGWWIVDINSLVLFCLILLSVNAM